MNAILEQINSAGSRFVEFAPPMFVQSSVLILILLLADFALRKKARAVFRYWIWMLVLVKLILPTSLSVPLSLGYFFGDQLAYVDGTEMTTETAQAAPAIVSPMINPPRTEAGSDTSAIATTTPTIEPAVIEPVNPPVVPLSWQGAVFLGWLTVVLTMGLLLLQRAIFVRGLVVQAKEANDSMADTLESCRERMGVKRKIGLKVSDNAASPAVCGLFRPVILVPKNLALNLNSGQLRAVLLHELAHIRRGDLWVNLAQTLLQIIYFYNPLLWLANAIIRRIREQAVDEMVLVAMGEKARQYPQTLVDVAKLAFKRPALSLRLIGVVESKNALAGRIKHILNRPIPKKAKLGILGLAVVIITAAILLPMATCTPGPPSLVIKGTVKDAQTGEPIAGARVFDDGYGPKPNWEQIRADERFEWGAITNTAGEYSFLTWPEHHTIKVEAPGYKAKRQSLYDGHLVFNKKDQEIFDFALESEKASDSSEFKKTLSNDVTVELVGLFGSESKGQLTWWWPDGTAMSKEESKSYEYKINPGHIRNRDDWKFEYGYILKFIPSDDLSSMTDVTVGHRMRYTFPRQDGIGIAYVESDEYQRKKGLAQTGEIRIAAAYGQPKSFSSENRVGQDADVFQLDNGATILLSAVRPDRYEPDRGLMVDTTVNAGDVDIKVFYESKDGNMRNAWADGTTGGPSLVSPHQRSKTMIQETFRLHSIAKEELKKIIVECRRFQGVTFKNIVLNPGLTTAVTAEYIQPQEQINAITATQADSIYPGELISRRPKRQIAVKNTKQMNPEFTAELDDRTSVELLALTKFEGGTLRWWSPEGRPIELPSITAEDIKHQGNIAAFRFYGPVDSFTSYYIIASSMHEIKEKWQIASSGIWLGVLGYPEERHFGKLYFRTKGKPGQILYTIPIKPSDIGKRRAINQYGVNNIQSFERTAFGGFTIELLHDDKLAGDEFAAVDRAGKMHEYTEGYSARNRSYMKYEFPAEELAAIVRQEFSYATVQFVNVSLQGKKTKVAIERIQRREPEQPKVNVDVDPNFTATMPNGVKVILVALGRLVDRSFQWWTPQAEPTSIPDILECDVEGYDVVLAYKVQGSNGFTSYSLQDDQLHRKKDDWLVRSHQLWMVPLDETTHVGTADFAVRAYGGPLETRLEIPLSEKEIGQEIEINKLGYEKVVEFTEVTPDSFRVKVTYNSKKRALGEFAAVDKAGKTHKRTSGAFWPGQCEVTFPISAKSLSHLVLQRQQIGQATFRNISLQPGQRTKLQIESRQVDHLIPPSQAKWSVQDIKTDVQVEDAKIEPDSSGEAVVSGELVGRLVDKNGNAMADAQIALSTEKIGVLVSNGKLQPIRSDVESRIVQTDSQGKFNFGQKPLEDFDLIVAHEKGFALVESGEFVELGEIHLQPWGCIEGQLAKGRKATENKIWMSSLPNLTWFRHKREYRYETGCDESGHFVFDKVPPGWFEVGYLTRTGENSWSLTSRTPVTVKPGRTTKMRLGGEGRPVTGRFVPPKGYNKPIYFGNGLRSLATQRPERPRPDNYDRMTKRQQQQWREQWQKTDEYEKYRDDYWHHPDWRQYTFFIEKDGSFRIDDVIAGKYQLTVWIEERLTGQGRPEEIAGYYGTIEVPEIPGGRSDEPLDLGNLELTMHNPLRVGDIAPLFEAKTLDGKDLKLIDYRGKFVLLSFWQPVFHPEKQQLQELYDTYGGNRQLEIIGLGGNDTLDEVKNYVRENAIPWPQIYTGEEFKSGIAKDYGIPGVPEIFLVGPDGRIIAKDLRGEKLKSLISETLEAANKNKTDVQVEVEQGNESSESINTEDYDKIPSDSVVVRVINTKGRIIPIKDVPYTRIYYRDATTGNPIGWEIDLQIEKTLSDGSLLVNHRDVLVRKFLDMNRETKRNDYTISMCFQPKEGPVFSATTLYPQKATDILSFVVPPRTKVVGVGNVAPDELAGRVVDVDGNPVAGATISVYPDRGLENHPFKTDSHGAFRIPGFGDRWCLYIEVDKDGYATQWLTDFEIGKSFIVTMDQSTVLQGVFVNDSGEQAGRTQITLAKNKLTMQPRRGNRVGPITITHETDDKGSYDFPVEPGLYDVKVASESGFFNRSKVFIGAGQIVSLPSTLKPGIRFQVKVVDSLTNKPIKGVDLWIDSRTPGRMAMKEGSQRTTDSKGLAVWESLMPGNTSFSIRKKGYCRWWSDACLRGLGTLEPVNNRAAYSWQRNIDSLGFDLIPDMPVVVIKMEEGVKLSGLVLSPDGKPVEKAAVDVTPVERPHTLTGDSRYQMITDDNGRFGIKEKYWRGYVPAGKQVLYNLCAHDPEARWANAVSKPFASKPADEFEFILKMTKGGSVSGRVIDSEGKPVPDIEVEAVAKDNLDTPYFNPRALTDENGNFTLGPMREGKYWIQPDTMKGVNIARSPKQEKTEVKVVDGKVTSVGSLLF